MDKTSGSIEYEAQDNFDQKWYPVHVLTGEAVNGLVKIEWTFTGFIGWVEPERVRIRPTPPASDNELEDCPFCHNQGWYPDYDRNGEVVQVQCEFCWTNPLSKFNAPAAPRERAR